MRVEVEGNEGTRGQGTRHATNNKLNKAFCRGGPHQVYNTSKTLSETLLMKGILLYV